MLAKVWTCAVVGLEGELVQVEVDIARQGLVQFNIVGLPDAAVQEARERVRAAVRNSGLIFPPRRVTVNLAPAEIRKSGPSYDLPIAIGVLLASEQIATDASKVVFLGEATTHLHVTAVTPHSKEESADGTGKVSSNSASSHWTAPCAISRGPADGRAGPRSGNPDGVRPGRRRCRSRPRRRRRRHSRPDAGRARRPPRGQAHARAPGRRRRRRGRGRPRADRRPGPRQGPGARAPSARSGGGRRTQFAGVVDRMPAPLSVGTPPSRRQSRPTAVTFTARASSASRFSSNSNVSSRPATR
jgi:Subunit ChlI of Mg-chelatase